MTSSKPHPADYYSTPGQDRAPALSTGQLYIRSAYRVLKLAGIVISRVFDYISYSQRLYKPESNAGILECHREWDSTIKVISDQLSALEESFRLHLDRNDMEIMRDSGDVTMSLSGRTTQYVRDENIKLRNALRKIALERYQKEDGTASDDITPAAQIAIGILGENPIHQQTAKKL